MKIHLDLQVDGRRPIPIRRQLTEQLKHLIAGGGIPPEQPLPSIRELAGFLGINANTVARVVEDLARSGYVQPRRGKGVFVAAAPPAHPSAHLREGFLRDTVFRAAALGMTADDVAVSVLSVGGVRPTALRDAVEVLVVECSAPELDFFGGQLEAHLPVHVDKVLLHDLPTVARRRSRHWRAAATSFRHFPDVERLLHGAGVPVIALLAGPHLETLQRLAQLRRGTRVGVVSAVVEAAHNLEHSIANAGLPNITLAGSSPADGAALSRLLRRVDVIVCPASAAAAVRSRARTGVQVMIDDRALDPRAVEMLAAVLVQQNGGQATGAGSARPARPRARLADPPTPRRSQS